jgi:hypothetical protein
VTILQKVLSLLGLASDTPHEWPRGTDRAVRLISWLLMARPTAAYLYCPVIFRNFAWLQGFVSGFSRGTNVLNLSEPGKLIHIL